MYSTAIWQDYSYKVFTLSCIYQDISEYTQNSGLLMPCLIYVTKPWHTRSVRLRTKTSCIQADSTWLVLTVYWHSSFVSSTTSQSWTATVLQKLILTSLFELPRYFLNLYFIVNIFHFYTSYTFAQQSTPVDTRLCLSGRRCN